MLPNPDPFPQFELVKFNAVRAQRGKEAAWFRVKMCAEDGWIYLWMKPSDILANIADFGQHPQLLKGLEAYGHKFVARCPQ